MKKNIIFLLTILAFSLQLFAEPLDSVELNRPDYATSVPEKCPDVMLQAFYYDSYDDKAPGNVVISGTTKVGDTKWSTLLKNSADIGLYFDMVWLPPSGKSEGGTGYHQTQYSNQNSAWGTKGELVEFINRMHANNTKVIADIVINHAGCMSSWCDFYPQYFSPYGTFNPDASWICKTDEVNGQTEDLDCKGAATGVDDGGYNGQDNYASARDWAHADTRVQNMMKAYLKWMKNVMGFDGWRYDYAQGFKGKYINMYNSASKNYFSVTEFWNGDMNNIKAYLNDCGWNTTVFDFSNKYCAIQGIADGNYSKCKNSGLQGTGDGRYAVTFVDSHDTYFGCKGGRDNQDEIGGCGKSMESYNKWRVLAANAYILSRPGIPCVFYPHWMKYKNEINKMVMARQLTGVHSESVCSDESAGSGYYKVTVTGTNGMIRLLLGSEGIKDVPDGFQLACKSDDGAVTPFAMYYKANNAETPRLSMTPSQTYKTTNFNVTMKADALSGTPAIYYTTDGTEPTEASTKYTAAITITGTKTVKAIAVLNGKKSAVMTATYTYKEPQTTPITLRFQHDNTWTGDVYIFTWDGASTGAWPGQKASIGVDGWYTYQCAASVKSTKFIWNNGKTGKLQTADLETDCDVCYKWASGCEEIDNDCGEIEVPFGIALNPESTKFRDKDAGIDVTITAVGVPVGGQATIYYTTDGTDPTTSSTSSKTNPVKLNFKKTTELRAMAISGTQKTSIVKAVYTYKEPQTTPIIVRFDNKGNWNKVNLYAWTTDGSETPVLGQWPGTQITAKDEQGMYYYQFPAQYKSVNIVWNNGSSQSGDILVEENTCFTWNGSDAVEIDCYVPKIYSVSVSCDLNQGSVEAPSEAQENTRITLKAIPNQGYYFTQWSDGDTNNPRQVVITQDTAFTAGFSNQYHIQVYSSDPSMGNVTGTNTYTYGDVATLTATPIESYQFYNWNDGNTDNPRYVTVLCDATYTAYFGVKRCTLTVKANDIMGGSVQGGGTFNYGTQVEISAKANSGYQFVKWSNGAKYNPYTFTIVEDMDLIAFFQKMEADIVDASDVNVTPQDNSVTVVWPSVEGAASYELVIKDKNGNVVCTLVFNTNGQLTQIVFSTPGRDHASQQTQSTGFSFTVTGLDEGTAYDLTISAKNSEGNVLNQQNKSFTTTGIATSVDNIKEQQNVNPKFLLNGQLFIFRDGKIYTVQGQEVK